MIENDHVLRARQNCIDFLRDSPPIQIVFQNDDCVCGLIRNGRERVLQGSSTQHRQPNAVALRNSEGDARRPADATQRLRADTVTEPSGAAAIEARNAFLKIAPSSEDGLYLVPKVIE